MRSLRKAGASTVLVASAVVVIAIGTLQIVLMQHGRDQAVFQVVAEIMLGGGVPYKDAWDIKPPGIYYHALVARVLFGDSLHSLSILQAFSTIVMIGAFAVLSRRHMGDWRAGLLGGALAVAVHVQLGFWHTAQAESFGAMYLVWGIVLIGWRPEGRIHPSSTVHKFCDGRARISRQGQGVTTQDWQRQFKEEQRRHCRERLLFSVAAFLNCRTRWRLPLAWTSALLCFTFSAFLKPQLGGAAVPGMIIALKNQTTDAPGGIGAGRAAVYMLLAVVIGVPLGVLFNIAHIVLGGGLPDFIEIITEYLPVYVRQSTYNTGTVDLLVGVLTNWPEGSRVLLLAGVGLFFVLRPTTPKEEEGAIIIVVTLLIQMAGIALQGKFFSYHYLHVLYLIALLAGWGCWKAVSTRNRGWVVVSAMAVLAAWSFDKQQTSVVAARFETLTDPSNAQMINDEIHSVGDDVNAGANRRVADWIRANTPANEPIYVWGWEATIYDQSNRKPSSRYIYNMPQRTMWSREKARAELMTDLKATRPSTIITVRRDFLKHATGLLADSEQTLIHFPELKQLIVEEYEFAMEIEDLTIYLRADLIEAARARYRAAPR